MSSQIYRADDAPRCKRPPGPSTRSDALVPDLRGNKILITICVFNLTILYPGTKLYYRWRNAQRDKIWNKMTSEEKSQYLSTTTDVGNRRLDFRFAH